ncbi:MAG: hypothetical protein Q9180_009443, partial [Flavoplaca navasiana]
VYLKYRRSFQYLLKGLMDNYVPPPPVYINRFTGPKPGQPKVPIDNNDAVTSPSSGRGPGHGQESISHGKYTASDTRGGGRGTQIWILAVVEVVADKDSQAMGGIQHLVCVAKEWIRAFDRSKYLPATGGIRTLTLMVEDAAGALDEGLRADKEKEEGNEEEEAEAEVRILTKGEQETPPEVAKVATPTASAAEAPTATEINNST